MIPLWQIFIQYTNFHLPHNFFFLNRICWNRIRIKFPHDLVNMPLGLSIKSLSISFFPLPYNLFVEEAGSFVLHKCPTVWILLTGPTSLSVKQGDHSLQERDYVCKWAVTLARHPPLSCINVSFEPFNTLCFCFSDDIVEIQRSLVACPRSHSRGRKGRVEL